MARAIDAELLKEVLERNFGHTGGAAVLAQLIDEQPTIDPVKNGYAPIEVVRQIQWERDAAIDQLKCYGVQLGEKAELQKKQSWISVKDRLPEKGKSVLVCLPTQGGIGMYVSERIGEDRWSALCGRKPSHWMPLPEPPERDDE